MPWFKKKITFRVAGKKKIKIVEIFQKKNAENAENAGKNAGKCGKMRISFIPPPCITEQLHAVALSMHKLIVILEAGKKLEVKVGDCEIEENEIQT